MIKKLGLLGFSLASALVLIVFGSLLLHYLDREAVYNPPPFKPAHAPEVLKDSATIVKAMKELATDVPVHPLKSGAKGERAVFQRNQYYLPSNKARSWETALKDIRLQATRCRPRMPSFRFCQTAFPVPIIPGFPV